MSEPLFLSKEEVLAIHRDQLERWGGTEGLRDEATLEGALGQAGAVYSFLEQVDLYDIAAAYAFSISEGQPFLDGNKRVGLNAALMFLALNDAPLPRDAGLYEAMMSVANGSMTRAGLGSVLKGRTDPSCLSSIAAPSTARTTDVFRRNADRP